MDASQLAGAYEATTNSDFQSNGGDTAADSPSAQQHGSTVRQQLYNTQQPLFKLLPLWRLRCSLCMQDPQPAASKTSNPDPAAAAVPRN